MQYKVAKEKILAAQALLLESSSSFDKFHAVAKLLSGVHPSLDEALVRAQKDMQSVEQILGKDFFSFAAENLPEVTEEQKKSKKAVLFFWKTWNTLRSEVSRVQAEIEASAKTNDTGDKVSHWGRILNFAKGPFGVLTLVAIILGSASSVSSVQVVIHNEGCGTMQSTAGSPVPIPGISIPSGPIPSGGSVIAALPGMPLTIDGTQKGKIVATVLTFSLTFETASVKEVTLDGEPLIGKKTNVNLMDKKSHDLVLSCL